MNTDVNDDFFKDDLPGNTRGRKNTKDSIKLDYNSDSSFDDYQNDEDQKTEERSKQEFDEDDDDMFASDTEEPENKTVLKDRKPEVELLDMKEFEKQEGIADYDEEKLSASEAEEESENEEPNQDQLDYYHNIENLDQATRKRAKKIRPKIEAFDLREESKEGNFDVDGNFLRKDEESSSAEDEWESSYKKSDILKAKKAQLARELSIAEKRKEALSQSTSIKFLLSQLIGLLDPVETPMEALARYNRKKKSKKSSTKKDEEEQNRKQFVFRLTEICEQLINQKAIHSVYDLTREELMRTYKQETGEDYRQISRGVKREREPDQEVDDAEEIDYGEKKWEFKWIGEDEVNGIYSDFEMKHWKETYFKNNVVVRRAGQLEFLPIESVEF